MKRLHAMAGGYQSTVVDDVKFTCPDYGLRNLGVSLAFCIFSVLRKRRHLAVKT